MTIIKQQYGEFINRNLGRLLTQIDRDPDSPTFGSCDRDFWHYKIRDFSSAILQQSGLFVGYAFNNDFPGNLLYKNSTALEIAKATLAYWMSIQLSDGSFNEYYPNEHGFPPTAFSFYSACETYRILQLNDIEIIHHLKKTADYLMKHDELQASNQQMAAISALYSYFLITDDKEVKQGVERKIAAFLQTQSPEGWFPEYGGADFGYQSVCLDMLAEYYRLSQDEKVLDALEKTVKFLFTFVHADGTIGGQYGSRNTTYFLPFGVELMASRGNAHALYLRQKLFANCDRHDYFLNAVDDRYIAHYVLHSFIRALVYPNVHAGVSPRTMKQDEVAYLPDCGLLRIRKNKYDAICSLRKGGIIRISKPDNSVLTNFGYRILRNKNSIATTNWLDDEYDISFDRAGLVATITGKFNLIKTHTSSTIGHAGLRIMSFLFGNRLIGFLKRVLIFGSAHLDVKFKRVIKFNETSVEIDDTVFSKENFLLKGSPPFSLRHVASSKFYTKTDVNDQSLVTPLSTHTMRKKITFDFITDKVESRDME